MRLGQVPAQKLAKDRCGRAAEQVISVNKGHLLSGWSEMGNKARVPDETQSAYEKRKNAVQPEHMMQYGTVVKMKAVFRI